METKTIKNTYQSKKKLVMDISENTLEISIYEPQTNASIILTENSSHELYRELCKALGKPLVLTCYTDTMIPVEFYKSEVDYLKTVYPTDADLKYTTEEFAAFIKEGSISEITCGNDDHEKEKFIPWILTEENLINTILNYGEESSFEEIWEELTDVKKYTTLSEYEKVYAITELENIFVIGSKVFVDKC